MPEADGEMDGLKVVSHSDASFKIGGGIEDVAVKDFYDGTWVAAIVDVTLQEGVDGGGGKSEADVIDEAGVKGDKGVMDLEAKAEDVDIGIETEGIAVGEVVEDGVEIDDGLLLKFVVVDDFIESQWATKLEVHAGEGDIESVVSGEESRVVEVGLGGTDGMVEEIVGLIKLGVGLGNSQGKDGCESDDIFFHDAVLLLLFH